MLGRRYGPSAIKIIPSSSAFSLVAARLIWPLADVECLTVHGRDLDRVKAFLMHGNRLIILANDGQTPNQLAKLLKEAGFSKSFITVFSHLGATDEGHFERGERSPAAGRLSGGPGPTLNEQSTCAEVAAWLVITSDRRLACVWSASAGTLLPAVRHQVRVWRPPRYR